MNIPKCSTNSLTGNTCYYEMANEHVNSGTEKEQLNNYEQEVEKP